MDPNQTTTPTPEQTPNVPVPESLEVPAVAVTSTSLTPTPNIANNTVAPSITETPAPTSQPTMAGAVLPPTKPKVGKKQLLFIAAVAALILGVGGFIFGYYLPNQPDYVWNRGVTNSGKAISQVVNDLTTTERMEKLKKTEVTITADVDGENYDFTGNLSSKLDTNKSSTSAKLDAQINASEKINLNVDVLTDLATDKIYPDIYFKVAGFKTLANVFGYDYLEAYDDKWITVSSEYFEATYATPTRDEKERQEQINSGDTAEFVKTISKISNEYLFSAKKDKAVLENKSFKGKEKVDDVDTFRYEVAINKENAKAYCIALTNGFVDLALAKKLGVDKDTAQRKKDNADKECEQTVKQYDIDGATFDAWINTKNKLIHKIRIYEKNDKSNYDEYGQIYKGSNKLTLFYANHNEKEKSDLKLVMDLDIKTITSKGTLTATNKTENGYTAKATIEVKPYSGEVKIEKPAGAIDIETIMQELGLGEPSRKKNNGASSGSRAKDVERQTDIKALQGQVEAYYAQNGFYPTLADINDSSWRKTNMKGLDDEALKDPDGTTSTLATTSKPTQYGYNPTGCVSNKECTAYTLEATLSDGQKYTKTSLN